MNTYAAIARSEKLITIGAPHMGSMRNLLVIASPVAIVALGSLAARVSIALLGQWAWAITLPIYWGSIALVIGIASGWDKLRSWFDKPRGSIVWPLLALLFGLSAYPLLLIPNIALLRTPLMIGLWLAFGLINGPIEEAYWRGFLFNEIKGGPLWLTVTYSGVLFIAIHFLMLGAFSSMFFNIPFLVILAVLTLFYSVIFIRTCSLRYSAISHTLTDWGNLNIFVFMNLIK